MEVSEAIRNRRSVRKFKDKRVPREDLVELVDYARLAPSGMNKQPLEFVIVDEPELERELFAYTSWAGALDWNPGMEERPRAYILILINPEVKPVTEKRDAGLAAENICLGAVDKELGSCLQIPSEKEEIRKLLGVSNDRVISLAIGLGYPDQETRLEEGSDNIDYWFDDEGVFHVPKRPVEDILHVNKWQAGEVN
ncbi:nitroreductase family protein [Candidatus Bipolaricaulota bacterium]|nr:nitroreductase family protein [Candidatus Bipolaricaulota bacterium]